MRKWKEDDMHLCNEAIQEVEAPPASTSRPAAQVRVSESEFEEVTAVWTESKPPEPRTQGVQAAITGAIIMDPARVSSIA